jgi:hypothetical protein
MAKNGTFLWLWLHHPGSKQTRPAPQRVHVARAAKRSTQWCTSGAPFIGSMAING